MSDISVFGKNNQRLPRYDYHKQLIENAKDLINITFSGAKSQPIRSISQFAEEEVVLSDGEYSGMRFRYDRQPYTRHLLELIDSDQYTTILATGPRQSGKTLSTFIIPTLYHLFEYKENVIWALPDSDMGGDKWREDLFPIIQSSKYRDLLPDSGNGSRGGKIDTLQFRNGATLKCMTAGGGDKSRAGFSSRVVIATEIDGFSSSKSETDKLTQILRCTESYARPKIYLECTVSSNTGRTWTEYKNSTQSRIHQLCPFCNHFVALERANLQGWEDADSEIDAARSSYWCCPNCNEKWTEDDRYSALSNSVLLHDGQSIDYKTGEIIGEPKQTSTAGIRWTAGDNLFRTAADIGSREWVNSQSANNKDSERDLLNFSWALPTKLDASDFSNTSIDLITSTISDTHPQGIIPSDHSVLVAGLDIGKYNIHWVCAAVNPENFNLHICDYGKEHCDTDRQGEEAALESTLSELIDTLSLGYRLENSDQILLPSFGLIDSGYNTTTIYRWLKQSNHKWLRAYKGLAGGSIAKKHTVNRTNAGNIRSVGENYQEVIDQQHRLIRVEADADVWKSFLHKRIVTPSTAPGHFSLYSSLRKNEHLEYSRHLLAEKEEIVHRPGQGDTVKWTVINKRNHFLDCTYLCCVAAHMQGCRLFGQTEIKKQTVEKNKRVERKYTVTGQRTRRY